MSDVTIRCDILVTLLKVIGVKQFFNETHNIVPAEKRKKTKRTGLLSTISND